MNEAKLAVRWIPSTIKPSWPLVVVASAWDAKKSVSVRSLPAKRSGIKEVQDDIWLVSFMDSGLDLPTKACWRSPGSRACCFSACVGSKDYAGPTVHSRLAWLPCCLPPTRNEVGILIYGLFAAQLPRPPVPLSTLQETPRGVPSSKTRGQDGFATSFPVGLLHPLQHAGLSRRTPACPRIRTLHERLGSDVESPPCMFAAIGSRPDAHEVVSAIGASGTVLSSP
jgi:hypothetical protein